MKLESAFQNFLKNTVNLNETRYGRAIEAIDTMGKLLKNNDIFGSKFIDLKSQGSFRQETIIKPVNPDMDFDVDLLFEMRAVDGWTPASYLERLANEFKKLDRYKDLIDIRGKTRCVTIDYETDFHIDIVPSVSLYRGQQVIMNKTTNAFETTDGDGYAEWFQRQSELTGKKHLIKVVRLMKYIRDSQKKFEIKSILLTTLLGNMVLSTDIQDQQYPDLPTAFLTLIMRLDSYLQANPTMRTTVNPVLSSENFNRHWDQDKYRIFREQIYGYARATSDAYDESNETKSLEKWQRVFGDGFVIPGHSSEKTLTRSINRDPGEKFLSDLGIRENLQYTVKIDANVTQDGFRQFSLRKSTFLLKKERSLDFVVTYCNVPYPFSIKWKIKNNGQEATSLNALRGRDC